MHYAPSVCKHSMYSFPHIFLRACKVLKNDNPKFGYIFILALVSAIRRTPSSMKWEKIILIRRSIQPLH